MEASRLSSVSIEGIQKKLQEEGFKLTLQRQATVEILLEHLNELLTAEEIYMYVKQK
ncbi:MAG: transcriptional repressor, partial [Streptococcus sp.]|nr:transcriptional repressor [Streptococcus sp.]